jgi:hypothetical protein
MDIGINEGSYMQNTCTDNSQLPFKCRMLCVSLIGGSLTLVFIFLIYYMGYISIEAALWVSMGAFIILAIYESFLLTLIARHMIKEINKN